MFSCYSLVFCLTLLAADPEVETIYLNEVAEAAPKTGRFQPHQVSTYPSKADPALLEEIRESGATVWARGDDTSKIVDLSLADYFAKKSTSYPFISKLHDLESLNVSGVNAKEWVPHLAGLEKLERISTFDTSGLDDEACVIIAQLTELKTLSILGSEITDAGIAKLAQLPKLETLSLSSTAITDQGLKSLSKMPSLKKLSLEGTHVTPEGLLALKDSSVIDLWWSGQDKPMNAALPSISQLTQLKHLTCRNARDADMRHIAKLTGLEELNLMDPELSPEGYALLEQLPGLKELTLHKFSPGFGSIFRLRNDDYILRHLSGMQDLAKLELTSMHITDAGIRQLTSLQKIKHLDLTNTSVTVHVIPELEKFTELEELHIFYDSMRGAPVLDFRGIPSLKVIYTHGFDNRKLLLPEGCYDVAID